MLLGSNGAISQDCGTPTQCYVKAAAMFNQAAAQINAIQAQLASLSVMGATLPVGTILPWYSKTGPVPDSHWAICDGQNDTPNLKNMFLRGAPSFAAVTGNKEGDNEHLHHVSNPPDTAAPFNGIDAGVKQGDGGYLQKAGNSHQHHTGQFDTDKAKNIPEYLAVMYICKIKP